MRVMFVVACALALAGCGTAAHQIRNRSDFIAEGTRTYQGETRERVIQAAEIVLKLSDPKDFEFRHNAAGFTGLRRYVIYAVIASAVGREKWEFNTETPAPGAIRASVTISEAGTTSGGYSTTPYEGTMASVPLYRLFWNRMDYMLGRRPDWVTCDQATEALQATDTNPLGALGGLCGATSEGRDAPAPPRLPPLPRTMAEPKPAHR